MTESMNLASQHFMFRAIQFFKREIFFYELFRVKQQAIFFFFK